jgi:hypothetical protein
MSRKIHSPPVDELFFLTSLFIELIEGVLSVTAILPTVVPRPLELQLIS